MGPGKKVTEPAIKQTVKSNADRLKELGQEVDMIQKPKPQPKGK